MARRRRAARWIAGASLAVLCLAAGSSAAAADPQPAESAKTLIDAAKASMMADPPQALVKARAAEQLARRETGPEAAVEVATAEWLEGEALMRVNRTPEAGPYLERALSEIAKLKPDTTLHGRMVMSEGGYLASVGMVQPALADFQRAFAIFGRAKDARGQAMALQNIGAVYQDARDYAKVLDYYAQSAAIYSGDPVLLVTAHNNRANALRSLGRYAEAEAEFRQALSIAADMHSPTLEARILSTLAAAEVNAGQLDRADRDVARGLRLAASDPGARAWDRFLWGVAAQSALKRGDAAGAARLLERTFKGENLAKTPLVFRDFHETAVKTYEQLGDDKLALQHLKALKRLDDEAGQLAASTNAALMAAKFDFANQQSRIAQLKAGQLKRDVELALSERRLSTVLLSGAAVIAALLLLGLLSLRRSRDQVREANRRLTEANRSLEAAVRARTEFLATTSHEVRTPLNGILGVTQVLLADPDLEPKVRDRVELAHQAGESMLALVNDILDMAKIDSGVLVVERQPVALRRALDDLARFWRERASAKGLELKTELDGAPEGVLTDAARLNQILANLMANALKFTEAGEVRLSAEVLGDRLVIRVADTGIGIPKDRQGDIFESFRQVDGSITRKYGGTGLGLAIARSLARALGGDLSVQSAPGQGATFILDLPCETATLAEPPAPAPAAQAAGLSLERTRLLVIDANPLTHGVLRGALQPQVGALEFASAAADAGHRLARGGFDLALADAATLGKEGRDPAEALAALVRQAPSVRFALTCAKSSPEEIERFTQAGAQAVIEKPVTAAQLAAALRKVMTQDTPEAATAGPAGASIALR